MIPIVILNRDRLEYTRNLVDQFYERGYDDITILDIASTYQPLLDWYKSSGIDIIYADNCGHKGLWAAGYIDRWRNYPWIAVTDSDISLHPDTPSDFIEQMITVAKDYRVDKVGLGIEYRGISNQYLKSIIEPIESKYWKQKLIHDRHQVTVAPTDTTMCIVQPHLPFQYHGVRLNDWPVTHLPWYEDWDNLTDEQRYYHEHADPIIATGTTHYLNYLSSK